MFFFCFITVKKNGSLILLTIIVSNDFNLHNFTTLIKKNDFTSFIYINR